MGTEDQEDARIDAHSKALWDALRPAYEAAHQLVELGSVFGLEGCGELRSALDQAVKGSPFGVGAERKDPMRSREAYIDDYLDSKMDDVSRHVHRGGSKHRVLITSITIDGKQNDSPLQKEAAAKYREYSFGVRVVEFRTAAEIGRAIVAIVRTAEPEKFRHAQSGHGATPAILAMSQGLRADAVQAINAAAEPMKAYADVVKRMETMDRLGGLKKSRS